MALDPASAAALIEEQKATEEMISLIRDVAEVKHKQQAALVLLTENTVQHTKMIEATLELAKRVDYLEGVIHELLGDK